MIKRITVIAAAIIWALGQAPIYGELSSGLTLLQTKSARATSLGGAASTLVNDIGAAAFNPATLATLQSSQVLLAHETGIVDESFSQIAYGRTSGRKGYGLSIGYFDGGTIEFYDGAQLKSVNAQTDYSASLTFSQTLGGFFQELGGMSIGVTGKYLSSELAEQVKATAYAADFGLLYKTTSRLSFGGALQNIGTRLKYLDESSPLPRIARAGVSYRFAHASPAILNFDVPYFMNERELGFNGGVEVVVGPLAMRGGYGKQGDTQSFFAGAGFMLGSTGLDYAFGLTDSTSKRHQINFSYRFKRGNNQ